MLLDALVIAMQKYNKSVKCKPYFAIFCKPREIKL